MTAPTFLLRHVDLFDTKNAISMKYSSLSGLSMLRVMYKHNNNPFTDYPLGNVMNRDSKELLIIVISAIVVVAVVMSALMLYSGMSRPLTVVESKSMQHSDTTSYLGIIDTGDMVVMISPDKRTPTTYVEGYQNGHCSFGSYGDVIIYYRGNGHPALITVNNSVCIIPEDNLMCRVL